MVVCQSSSECKYKAETKVFVFQSHHRFILVFIWVHKVHRGLVTPPLLLLKSVSILDTPCHLFFLYDSPRCGSRGRWP